MRSLLPVLALSLIPSVCFAEEEETRMASKPLAIAGMTSSIVGAGTMPFGILMAAITSPRPAIACTSFPCDVGDPDQGRRAAGLTIIVISAAAMVAGATMFIVGVRQVAVEPSAPDASAGMSVRVRF